MQNSNSVCYALRNLLIFLVETLAANIVVMLFTNTDFTYFFPEIKSVNSVWEKNFFHFPAALYKLLFATRHTSVFLDRKKNR